LFPKTATLSGRVTSGGPRNAIAGATVVVQFLDVENPIEDPSLTLKTTTDSEGLFSLTGLPAGSPTTRVIVLPTDTNGDGRPDTAVFSNFVTGTGPVATLVPDGETFMEIPVDQYVPDGVLWTNIDDTATIEPSESIVLTFAAPMAGTSDSSVVTLTDGDNDIAVQPSWSKDGVELTIDPVEPLVAGGQYSLTVNALSASGNLVAYSHVFVVTSADAPAHPVSGIRIVNLEPVAWDERNFTIQFDRVDDAQAYRIYARNSDRQTAWVKLFEGPVSAFQSPQVNVQLPDVFNTFPDSPNTFSAVGFKTTVDFAVQPYNGRNDGPFGDEVATFEDVYCPSLQVQHYGPVNNSGGTDPLDVIFVISSTDGEPLGDDIAPKFKFTVDSDVGGYLISTSAMKVRRVLPNAFAVLFKLPAGEDATGTQVSVDLRGVTDTSGNKPDGSADCPSTWTSTLSDDPLPPELQ
jgi:hypothetical protein